MHGDTSTATDKKEESLRDQGQVYIHVDGSQDDRWKSQIKVLLFLNARICLFDVLRPAWKNSLTILEREG